jgi:hypothetical protein
VRPGPAGAPGADVEADYARRQAVIALITAHIKSVIAADVDAPEPAWHDFVRVVSSVVCVLQSDGRPPRSVVAVATLSYSATSSATGPAGTSSNGSSASLLTSSSAALLAHVASLSEALYQHLNELDMVRFCGYALRRYLDRIMSTRQPRPPPPGKTTAASKDDLVVVLKCTELVIAIRQRETLTEWQSDDERPPGSTCFLASSRSQLYNTHTHTQHNTTHDRTCA